MRVDVRGGSAGPKPAELGESVPVSATTERGGIVTRASVARGRSLSPGIQKSTFFWRDVVHGPPPRRREKGDCIHVTFHGTDDSGDVRLAFTSLIRVDPGMDKASADDDVVHVEERVYVQRRLLQELIDREHNFTDRVCLRMRSRLAQSLAQKRRRANHMESAKAAAVLLAYVRFRAKTGNASIRAFRAVMRGLVALPDALLTHTERVSIHLASSTGRRWLRKAVHDPASATPQEKTGLLVLLAFATIGVILALGLVFATVLSRWSAGYTRILEDFTLSMAGTLALPIPGEILYINSAVKFGIILAAVGIVGGKLLASWMLYLVGDSLFDTMNKGAGPKMKKAIGWLQRNADRWGFTFLLLLNFIPLAPDALIVVFAVSGMRFRSYMLSIAIGAILKIALLAGLILWIGPEAVTNYITHPIASIRGS